MLFNSFHFVVFFVIVLALNQSLRRWPGAQKLMLLAASYYFYGQWNWLYLVLILFSTVTDYAIGLGLVKVRRPRQLLIISLIVNLGVLFFFKYANWMIGNWNAIDSILGSGLTFSPLDLLLPVGISFYTFQSMSYTIDVYRGDSPPRRNFLDYSLFIAFFPQLVAGPIVRDGEFFHELDRDRSIDFAAVRQALVLIALGYVKKIVVADNLASIVDPVFDATVAQGFWDTLLAIYAFAFQIYCDFSGYTDIAIGCALLLGFRFPKNFNYPYVAESIQDFWRRWHMTLSRWLRDYLYISLGGNRKGPSRTRINLMLTMLLGGLWHGASWNFVIWGGLHGLYLAIERVIHKRWPGWNHDSRSMRWLRVFITFHLVCFAWIFFRAHDLAAVGQILGDLGQSPFAGFEPDRHLGLCILLGGLGWAQFLGNDSGLKRRISDSEGPLFIGAMTAAMLMLIWFTPTTTAPFIYFQF
ncbi:MAG TPA: MBOAT family O-acyltransferase [Dokdonella sp.]|uniref:MBOAT family O-acyltransferase n=1 Tax=Dokdonella sp. TaxID=2291710 RepID=UPI002D7F0223|nr:MBOAT family O-acyltransferase [Dokdonella sp.]HET9033356.1 MBOAT family O-acyltransferase [Dokdonella sp.]